MIAGTSRTHAPAENPEQMGPADRALASSLPVGGPAHPMHSPPQASRLAEEEHMLIAASGALFMLVVNGLMYWYLEA